MAHPLKGYDPSGPDPRPVAAGRLGAIRIFVDPANPVALQLAREEPGQTVRMVRELLEHVDALQADLDKIDRGFAEALGG